MSKLSSKVIDIARENLEIAESIWREFSGKKQGGIDLTFIGEYVVCDDGQDRWLATADDYQDGLNAVLASAIKGQYDKDDNDAYSDLCGECPAMYSNIGSGEYNERVPELLALLRETLDDEQVEELCRELNIDVAEIEA